MIGTSRAIILIAFASLALAQNATNETTIFNNTATISIYATNETTHGKNLTLKGNYKITNSIFDGAPLNLTDLSVIKNDTKLVIIVPSLDHLNPGAYKELINAYKNAGNYTVLKMCWANTANYSDSLHEKIEIAGDQLAMLITALQNNGVNESNIHIIGNEVGVKVASYAAKMVPTNNTGRIGRLTALNPPGNSIWGKIKKFFTDDETELKPTDADVVDTLRTMNGYSSTGGVDFYANKGKDQPGCYHEDSCYLERGLELMAESVQSKNFVAQKCTYGFFKGWVCSEDNVTIFGENMPKGVFEGNFVFYTKSVPPYAKGY